MLSKEYRHGPSRLDGENNQQQTSRPTIDSGTETFLNFQYTGIHAILISNTKITKIKENSTIETFPGVVVTDESPIQPVINRRQAVGGARRDPGAVGGARRDPGTDPNGVRMRHGRKRKARSTARDGLRRRPALGATTWPKSPPDASFDVDKRFAVTLRSARGPG